MEVDLDVDRHARFFAMHVRMLPNPYSSLDCSRMTALYFALSALDVIGRLDKELPPGSEARLAAVEWIYAQQYAGDDAARCGFRGGPWLGVRFGCAPAPGGQAAHDQAHLAQTYTALASLLILGDDLSRVRREETLAAVGRLQRDDGSFQATAGGTETDVRFVYCACAVSVMLGDARCGSFDGARAAAFVASCQSYDGGFALAPAGEGHGGSTYTAVASLALLGRLDDVPDAARLREWVAMSQGAGYCGRPNKPPDTCYSFWIGATAAILGMAAQMRHAENAAFNMSCEGAHGGFGKHADSRADIMHSYMGLAGLSLAGAPGLAPLDPRLGVTVRAAGAAAAPPRP